MIDPDRALEFLSFVEQRHIAWRARQMGDSQPWCSDQIVMRKKFTNVFRILDWDSQFLVRELMDPDADPRDVLMRCFLFRHTGRLAAWEYLELNLGWPTVGDLDEALQILREYRGRGEDVSRGDNPSRNAAGSSWKKFERPVFTSAYLVFPQTHEKGSDKLESIIRLTQRLFTPGSSDDIVPDFLAARTQEERFHTLRRNKGVADFMSMQVLTDWGYSPHCGEDREDEFVRCGPGATKGAKILDPLAPVAETLMWAVDAIRALPRCPTIELDDNSPNEVRVPSWMDAQNTLCEFSKYVRYSEKPLPPKMYAPAHPGPQPAPVLPQHW